MNNETKCITIISYNSRKSNYNISTFILDISCIILYNNRKSSHNRSVHGFFRHELYHITIGSQVITTHLCNNYTYDTVISYNNRKSNQIKNLLFTLLLDMLVFCGIMIANKNRR